MSRLFELNDRIRSIGEELPVGQVAGAAGRLRAASGLLAWAMHASARPTGAPMLTVAGEHLDRAAGALLAAREALTGYLVAIGLPRDGVPADNSDWQAALVPARPTRPPARPETSRLVDFWADRVDLLADRVGAPRDQRDRAAGTTSAELLHRGVTRVLDEDADRLRRELAAADPAAGLGLAAVTPPLLRYLAADLVGHPPRAQDLPTVRRAAMARLGKLLPNLPEQVAEAQLARACHATGQPEQKAAGPRSNQGGWGPQSGHGQGAQSGRGQGTQSGHGQGSGQGPQSGHGPGPQSGYGPGPQSGHGQPHHPVDVAVAGVVLVAGLLAATGRGADQLAKVAEELRQGDQQERRRAELRRQAADESRRRAVQPARSGLPEHERRGGEHHVRGHHVREYQFGGQRGGQPRNGQPDGQPGNGQPDGQPGNGQPDNGQPDNGQPGNDRPGNDRPGDGQPGGRRA